MASSRLSASRKNKVWDAVIDLVANLDRQARITLQSSRLEKRQVEFLNDLHRALIWFFLARDLTTREAVIEHLLTDSSSLFLSLHQKYHVENGKSCSSPICRLYKQFTDFLYGDKERTPPFRSYYLARAMSFLFDRPPRTIDALIRQHFLGSLLHVTSTNLAELPEFIDLE
ncbi:MAG: hypothetical protein ACFFCZ_16060 [Promethearchaeota archaeon]